MLTVLEPQAAPAAPVSLPELKVSETERDDIARKRACVVEALRQNGHRQIRGRLYDQRGGACFVGMAAEALRGGP